MFEALWIALGGALGSVARYWVSGFVAEHYGELFPFGTLAVNVSGSLLIGFLAVLMQPDGRFLVSPGVRQFLLIGVCGGYTTFSSFSLQTLNLMRDGEWLAAGLNTVLSFAACLVAVALGCAAALWINRP